MEIVPLTAMWTAAAKLAVYDKDPGRAEKNVTAAIGLAAVSVFKREVDETCGVISPYVGGACGSGCVRSIGRCWRLMVSAGAAKLGAVW